MFFLSLSRSISQGFCVDMYSMNMEQRETRMFEQSIPRTVIILIDTHKLNVAKMIFSTALNVNHINNGQFRERKKVKRVARGINFL